MRKNHLALTTEGCLLQEANDRVTFILFQITSGEGFRGEIERIVKELRGMRGKYILWIS